MLLSRCVNIVVVVVVVVVEVVGGHDVAELLVGGRVVEQRQLGDFRLHGLQLQGVV